jgi:hypothetical protein
MHNYLKTLDTKQLLKAKIKFQPIFDNGLPHLEVECNGVHKYNNDLGHTLAIYINFGILEPFTLNIAMTGKKYSAEKETAIVIEEFVIDGFDVVPYLNQASYSNDQNYNGGTSNYLGFNGIWSFKINEPFYNWLHRNTGQGWLLTP